MSDNKTYTVKSGDTPSSVSIKAYGSPSYASNILQANGKTSISVGDILVIPAIPGRRIKAPDVFSGEDKDSALLLIAGNIIRPTSLRVFRAIDAGANGWTAVMKWTPGENADVDACIRPFRYSSAAVYLGGTLVVNGAVYGVSPVFGDKEEMRLEGFSYSVDAIDSTINPPYQWYNITLEQHASQLLKQCGLSAIFDYSSGSSFGVIDAEPTTKIFAHLAELAFQRELIITSTPEGNFRFTRAAAGKTVGTIEEGKPGGLEWSAIFDGRKRFHTYRAFGYSPLAGDKAVLAYDSYIPRSRTHAVSVDDVYSWDIGYAAEWQRSKQIAEAVGISLPVFGWYAPDGSLWDCNTLVTIVSKTLMVPKGFTFLIRSVEFTHDNEGRKTELTLVPPGVFAKRGERTTDPWE